MSLLAENPSSFLKSIDRIAEYEDEANGRRAGAIRKIFVFLCILYLFNSVERGILPPIIIYLMGAFSVDTTEAGAFESFFVAGLTVFLGLWSFLYSFKPKTFFWLGCGYSIWFLSCVGCSLSGGFVAFAISRFMVGAGDAAMNVLGVPWVDAHAPTKTRARMVSMFSMMFVVGDSIGLMSAGAISQAPWNTKYTWRTCYMAIAVLTLPLVIGCFCIEWGCGASLAAPAEQQQESIDLTTEERAQGRSLGRSVGGTLAARSKLQQFRRDVCNLLGDPLVVLAIFGFASLQLMVAVVGFWSIPFVKEVFSDSLTDEKQGLAGLYIGLTTLGSTFLGVPIGGTLLDCIGVRMGGKTVTLAFTMAAAFTAVGIAIQVLAFVWTSSVESFLLVLGLSYVAFMCASAAVTPATLWIVKPSLRVNVSALVVLGFNLFGKIPGPAVVGGLLKLEGCALTHGNATQTIPNMGSSLTGAQAEKLVCENGFPRWVLGAASLWVGWAVVFWLAVAVLAKRWGVGQEIDSGKNGVEERARLTKRQGKNYSNFEDKGREPDWDVAQ